MSSYHAGQVHFNACLHSSLTLLPELRGQAERMRATALAGAARLVPADPTLRQLDAVVVGVTRMVPEYAKALRLLAPEPYQRASVLTDKARTLAQRDPIAADRLASTASAELRSAFVTSATELGRRERQVIADVVVQAARNLGYSVQTSTGRQITAVEARRDHDVVIIAVGDGGSMEMDHAGLADSSCLDRQQVLESEMSRLGVDLRDTRRIVHPERHGGVLITAAARQGDRLLARAVVRQKEPPPTDRMTQPRPVRPPLVGDAGAAPGTARE